MIEKTKVGIKAVKTLHIELADAMNIVIREETLLKDIKEELDELKEFFQEFRNIHRVKNINTKTKLLEQLISSRIKGKGRKFKFSLRKSTRFAKLLRRLFSKIESHARKLGLDEETLETLSKAEIYEKTLLKALSEEGEIYKAIKVFNRARNNLKKELGDDLTEDISGIEKRYTLLYNQGLAPLLVLLKSVDKELEVPETPKSSKEIKREVVAELKHGLGELDKKLIAITEAKWLKQPQRIYYDTQRVFLKRTFLFLEQDPLTLEKRLAQFLEEMVKRLNKETTDWLISEIISHLIRPTLFLLQECHTYKDAVNLRIPSPELAQALEKLKAVFATNKKIQGMWVNVIQDILQRSNFVTQRFQKPKQGQASGQN